MQEGSSFMRWFVILSIVFVCACAKEAEIQQSSNSPVLATAPKKRDTPLPAASQSTSLECSFSGEKPACAYSANGQVVNVSIVTKKVADNEIELTAAVVSVNGKEQILQLTEDTSMIDGSIGIVTFDDINFDGVPDLGISTSFGTANSYLDYWICDAEVGDTRRSETFHA
jgi:hypothetical protein